MPGYRQYIHALVKALPFCYSLLFCLLIHISFGYGLRIDCVLTLFFILAITAEYSRFLLVIFVFVLGFSAAFYMPTGIIYGAPSFNSTVAVFYTDKKEALAYLRGIPWRYLLLSALLLALGVATLLKPFLIRWRLFKRFALAFILVSLLFNPLQHYYQTGKQDLIQFTPVRFYKDIAQHYQFVTHQYRQQQHFLEKPDTWLPVMTQSPYDTHIVVIGESVRRDFMHAYGFPLSNTPFISTSNGWLFTNYIAAGPSTVLSLTRSLTLTVNNHSQLNNNIVSLAKKSGFETYWFSNQGALGSYNSPIASIGLMAHQSVFLNKADHDNGHLSDNALLTQVTEVLKNPKRKLIIVHLIGSHPPACLRTNNYYGTFYHSEELSCYIESIKNTDALLAKIVGLATASQVKWSLLYFADHGLSLQDKGGAGERLIHSDRSKQNYEVPFFITAFDATKRTHIQYTRSGMDFLAIFADWLKITQPTLQKACRLLENISCYEEIQVLNAHNRLVDFDSLKEDAIQ